MKASDLFAILGIIVICVGIFGTAIANYMNNDKLAGAFLYFCGCGGLMLLAFGVVLTILGL